MCAMKDKLTAGIGEKDEPVAFVPSAFDDGERLAVTVQLPEASALADLQSVCVYSQVHGRPLTLQFERCGAYRGA